jgi:hypothetical protein
MCWIIGHPTPFRDIHQSYLEGADRKIELKAKGYDEKRKRKEKGEPIRLEEKLTQK